MEDGKFRNSVGSFLPGFGMRVIRTLRTEVRDHILILSEADAREVLGDYQRHDNQHRRTTSDNTTARFSGRDTDPQ